MTGGIKPVDIIVPCLNNLQYTRKCYESLKKNTQISFKLTFVDNGSRLPTQNYLKNLIKEDKRVKVIRNPQNLGAPAAFNQGIFATSHEKIILLNNDTILTSGWALKLLKALESQSKVGIAAPVLNPPSSKTMTLKEIDRMAAFIELKNRGSIREVPGVTSTCMALKREVVDKIGGFDENYGVGTNDDHDFCLRAREAGYKIVCSEEVFIYHYWNKTLGKMGIKELDKRNREYFIKKFGDRALKYLAETGQLRTLSKDSSD